MYVVHQIYNWSASLRRIVDEGLPPDTDPGTLRELNSIIRQLYDLASLVSQACDTPEPDEQVIGPLVQAASRLTRRVLPILASFSLGFASGVAENYIYDEIKSQCDTAIDDGDQLLTTLQTLGAKGDEFPKKVGELHIDIDRGLVKKNDEELYLTKTEFKLLVELAAHEGRIRSREQLAAALDSTPSTIDTHIRRLRTKIEADPASPRYVTTRRGMGYFLQN